MQGFITSKFEKITIYIIMIAIFLLLLCALHQHSIAMMTDDIKDYWYSGIIDSNLKTMPEARKKQSVAFSFLGSISSFFIRESDPTEKDNFIQARLPIIKNRNIKMRQILFVSPHILLNDTKAVRETFAQLYCDLIGILLKSQDIVKMQNDGLLLPIEPCQILKHCLEQFENRTKMTLEVAIIDARPNCLPHAIIQEFMDRNISLYKHPLEMSTNEIFYIRSDKIEEEQIIPSLTQEEEQNIPPWIEEFQLIASIHQTAHPYRILRRYVPIVSKEEMALEESLRAIALSKLRTLSDEYVRRLEPIYGQFVEIPIEEKVSSENNLSQLADSDVKEYEFIKAEDYLG